ncbi:hypothetical protein BDA96_07G114200 [Sorghum bicolor]|uniref:Uncharacterized protein n=2 Tax=Sorghum bicolor TaxID=4558 RepID=A0A921QMS4_SORBI|nr:hypothetical protein BDA96_07G114200 [Sorghum bicolor]KXG24989.1 hypothetical protein SORBI_3007G108000 [Sorghum bicolor]
MDGWAGWPNQTRWPWALWLARARRATDRRAIVFWISVTDDWSPSSRISQTCRRCARRAEAFGPETGWMDLPSRLSSLSDCLDHLCLGLYGSKIRALNLCTMPCIAES